RHQATAENVLSGWHGHAAPFAFETDFRPADGTKVPVSLSHVLHADTRSGTAHGYPYDDVADGSTYIEDTAPTATRLRLTPFTDAA
ncbi:hypothetical protein ABZW11_20085, partial [Nonomuraea sp. NPDC004580]